MTTRLSKFVGYILAHSPEEAINQVFDRREGQSARDLPTITMLYQPPVGERCYQVFVEMVQFEPEEGEVVRSAEYQLGSHLDTPCQAREKDGTGFQCELPDGHLGQHSCEVALDNYLKAKRLR